MMQQYTEIDPNAAYSIAFQSVGLKWAKSLVALGALKGMTTVLLVGSLGQARYTAHIARAHMIPPWFSRSPQNRDSHICHSFDYDLERHYCFLLKLRCTIKLIISQHFIYLHDDGSSTSSEKVLCERCNLS